MLVARVLPCPPLARLSVSQNTNPSHTSPAAPPPAKDRRFVSGVDAGHRPRDAGKRGGSIGRGPALLSPLRSRVGGRRRRSRRCCPLTVARPPAVSSCAVATGGELSCTVFPERKSAGTAIACRSLQTHWMASACEIMVDSDDDYFFKNFIDTSSDEDSDDEFFTDAALIIHEHIVSQIPVHQGSLPGRAAALDRKREHGHDQLFTDYFQPKALFTPAMFRRRFRMSRTLFRRIMDGVKLYDDYFCAKVDAIGKVGLSSYQKCTAAIRMLAYGVAGDFVDEYTRMSESTGLEAMYRFCRAVRLAYGQSPDVDFETNGHHYTKGYYLADGIYPPWATLVKTIRKPNSEQEARFAKEQEAARKDVERAFDILQARWAIVRHPARAWDVQTLWEVMTACVIMHNMIVEVERDDSLFDNDWEGQGEFVTPQGGPASFQDILHAHHEIRDLAVHNQPAEHMWQHVGNNAANNNDDGNPEA
ncbi:hypothetical protein QYE76_027514 [Lolium multiflorum]|uniref:DDE Tnp4 domain-containing protein n=1 Tax=Lolium multiflorum TaxID=4521 RepID=A0AAD8QJ93_LOLMU|nr:hypothetical protein QYE76_027514 [Lolium multiflorum]